MAVSIETLTTVLSQTATSAVISAGQQGPMGPQGDAGPAGAGADWLGPWDAEATYAADDIVSYQGSSWLARQASTGSAPTEGADWTIVAQKGDQGDPGADGQDGSPGADGTDGNSILNGSGAPGAGVGVDGDFYLDTTAHSLYGPKTAGAWGSGTSLIGPAGADGQDGADGAAGQDGRTILNGTTAPDNATGSDGDFYLDTATSTLYGPKAAGAWPAGVSLIGPKGDQGDPGAAGSDATVTFGPPSLTLGTANADGATDEVLRRDATLAVFDATAPSTQTFGDAAAAGDAAVAARRDHKHAMPADPVPAHSADTTAVHGITDTANLVTTDDSRLTDSRAPSGPAGGVLGGTYPNPSFAADMATQAELDAHAADTTSVHGITDTSALATTTGAETLSNKTLTNPKVDTLRGSNNLPVLDVADQASAVNHLEVVADIAGAAPRIGAAGSDTDIDLNLLPKGAGVVRAAGVPVETTTGSQAKVDAHTGDTADAHDASAVSFDDSTASLGATDVQGAIEALAASGGGGSGAMTLIDTQTVAVAAASVTFSSIPGTYTHLVLIGSLRGTTTATSVTCKCQLNGDTGSNYDYGNGQFQASATTTNVASAQASLDIGLCPAASATSGYASSLRLLLANYAGTTWQKTVAGQHAVRRGTGSSDMFQIIPGGYWRNTAAITSLTFFPSAGNFEVGTTLTLYGVS